MMMMVMATMTMMSLLCTAGDAQQDQGDLTLRPGGAQGMCAARGDDCTAACHVVALPPCFGLFLLDNIEGPGQSQISRPTHPESVAALFVKMQLIHRLERT